MNDQLISISSLAMDLKRASLGSHKVFKVFIGEALKRKKEINKDKLPLYIQNVLEGFEKNDDKEDLLMYSTLLQNYTLNYERK